MPRGVARKPGAGARMRTAGAYLAHGGLEVCAVGAGHLVQKKVHKRRSRWAFQLKE
jgi:hypothetical protein